MFVQSTMMFIVQALQAGFLPVHVLHVCALGILKTVVHVYVNNVGIHVQAAVW
jgi:hypothetical protein